MTQSKMDRWKYVQQDYLSMRPLDSVRFGNEVPDWQMLTEGDQEELLTATLRHHRSKTHPPSLQYRISFLKYIIKKLEQSGVEICDPLYEDFGELMGMPYSEEGDMCYKTYVMPDGVLISLKESKQLISKGTTGLRTWQAAQYLAEWAMENRDILVEKRILELGSGLGFTGLVVCKQCSPKSFIFSDSHSGVMKYLSENIEDNATVLSHLKNSRKETVRCAKKEEKTLPDSGDFTEGNQWEPNENFWHQRDLVSSYHCARWQHKTLQYMNLCVLDWEKLSMENMNSCVGVIDLILAADVVYDSSIIPPLVNVLDTLLKSPHGPVAYIASTVRNEATRDEFFTHLDKAGIKRTNIPGPKENIFIYDKSTPLQIIKLHKETPAADRN